MEYLLHFRELFTSELVNCKLGSLKFTAADDKALGVLSLLQVLPAPVTITMRRVAHPFGYARCGAGADCSAMK